MTTENSYYRANMDVIELFNNFLGGKTLPVARKRDKTTLNECNAIDNF